MHSRNPKDKRCSDFNYWLHLEIKHRKLGKNTDTFYSQIDTLIEGVCTNLHEKYYSCAKDKCYLDKEGLDMKKELHHFCGNRDITVMSKNQYSPETLNTWFKHRIGSIKNCKKKKEASDEAASLYTGILGDHPPTSPILMNISTFGLILVCILFFFFILYKSFQIFDSKKCNSKIQGRRNKCIG
ncbi:hypothetical protein POVCU1_052980 [Plasmodium ovale curtisi]|uniref:PIR Superfamily Protein n=1 Tax=Plasmodium ovale curtisi TaxID=864141 RepID=A0A1A8X2L8_PLAOA|nr:hypothetical protein POVCU1_052980 [Plasmodium ovale curtisi]